MATFDENPGTTKRALTAEMRQARLFLSGAIALLAAGEEPTADTALDMAGIALANARDELQRRMDERGVEYAGQSWVFLS